MFRVWARCILLIGFFCAFLRDAPSQTSAVVSLEKVAVNAGEQIVGSITLDAQSPCSGYVFVALNPTPSNTFGEIDLAGSPTKGQLTIRITANTPFDHPGGEYNSSKAGFKCDGFQNARPLSLSDAIHVSIIPVPDQNLYPTQAKVELTVSQKQFLETKAHELDDLLVRFANGIEQYPATTEDQKKLLVSIIGEAQSALSDAEEEYRKQILKPSEPIPVFFEDFREHYQDLETEVKARKISSAPAQPHLVHAQLNNPQLKKRPNQQHQLAKPSTTLTPDAEATSHLIEDNKKAYKYVEETGGATFTTSLMSIPDGARVSYRRTTQPDFTDYPAPTNVTSATFPMAYLQFRFHKDNCGDDQFLRINPWDDPKAPIKMEFTKCH